MRFGDHIVMFNLGRIPMIGNLNNGFTIGLTSQGASLCARIYDLNITDEEARRQDPELFAALRENDFLNEEKSEMQLRTAYLHVTQRCNLNCRGCYSLDDSRNALNDASTAKMKKAVDELVSAGCESLFISGGEPFMRADLPEIIEYAKRQGIERITLITNGTRIRREVLEQMAPFVDVVAVSFDGYSSSSPAHIRSTQRFDELVAAVALIKEVGISAHITPTIHAKNVHDLQRYAELASSLGTTMNYSLLSCAYTDGLSDLIPSEKDLEFLGTSLLGLGASPSFSGSPFGANLNVNLNCGAGTREISIAADGTVYPCHMLHRPEWALGNVFEEHLPDILANEKALTLKSLNVEEFEHCGDCCYKFLCGGGCRARSLFRYGDLNHRDAYCTMSRSYFSNLEKALNQHLAP